MKKILILYAKYGGGHLSAANALENYLKNNYSTICDVQSIDCVEYINKYFSKVTTGAYKKMARNAPKLWKKVYYGATHGPLSHASKELNRIMSIKLNKLFKEYQPDIVLSVHPFGSQMTSYLKKHKHLNCKLATIFTDFAPHEQWLIGKEFCDYFFVSNENMKTTLISSYDIDEQKIHVTGIPLSSRFNGPFDNSNTMQKYNLNPEKKLVLFFGGGEFGLGKTINIQILRSLTKHLDNYQILAISGKNKKMYDEFLNIAEEVQNKDLHVIEYTTDVPDLMHISSLVITKPGGLTSSESLASHLPIIIINPIPGQEEENAEFLEKSGSAIWLKNSENVEKLIDELLQNSDKLNMMKQQSILIAKPNSTADICSTILN